MTSRRQRRVQREILAAGSVYSGPFENEWLITGPDTIAPELKERLRRLSFGVRYCITREEALKLGPVQRVDRVLKAQFEYRLRIVQEYYRDHPLLKLITA